MCTGFSLGGSGNCVIKDLCDWDSTGRPVLDPECDMSAKTRNLFVCGPMVKHQVEKGESGWGEGDDEGEEEEEKKEDVIFCFVYKYRCRFPIVAGKILANLITVWHVDEEGKINDEGRDDADVVLTMMDTDKKKGMLVQDLTCATCSEAAC